MVAVTIPRFVPLAQFGYKSSIAQLTRQILALDDQVQQKQKPQLREQPGPNHVIRDRDVKEQPLDLNVTSNY